MKKYKLLGKIKRLKRKASSNSANAGAWHNKVDDLVRAIEKVAKLQDGPHSAQDIIDSFNEFVVPLCKRYHERTYYHEN